LLRSLVREGEGGREGEGREGRGGREGGREGGVQGLERTP